MAIEQTKEFTGGFMDKPFFENNDNIAGTDESGKPIRILFSKLKAKPSDESVLAIVDALTEKMIGVPKVEYINPTSPQVANATSYVRWNTNQWEWRVKIPIINAWFDIQLQLGTKVSMNGAYYILQINDTYTIEENVMFENIGVISATVINPSSPNPVKPYVSWNPLEGGSWSYVVKTPNPLAMDNKIAVGNIVRVLGDPLKYYRLEEDGEITEINFDQQPFDYIAFLKNNIGVVSCEVITDEIHEVLPDIPTAYWNGNTNIDTPFWTYYPKGKSPSEHVRLEHDSVVKLISGMNCRYFKLNNDGTQTPVIF